MKNIMHVLTLSHQVSLAESFGINTNILDTNLINLAIVIGVLFYFGKGVLQNTLRSRKQDIIKKIQDVKESYEQIQNKLMQARLCLEEAKKKKDAMYANAEIEKQRQQTIFQETVSDMKQRFQNAKDASIRLEIQQIRQEVCRTISISALKRAKDAMGTRITPEMQRRIIDYKIGILNSIK